MASRCGASLWDLKAHGGGLASFARRACGHLSQAAAVREGSKLEQQATDLLRRISVTLQRGGRLRIPRHGQWMRRGDHLQWGNLAEDVGSARAQFYVICFNVAWLACENDGGEDKVQCPTGTSTR